MSGSFFTGIHLNNFRAFTNHTNVPLRPITLLYGQNSAGKSSVIKTLLLLQQSTELGSQRRDRPFIFSGSSADLGSFVSTVSNHRASSQMTVGVSIPAQSMRSSNNLTKNCNEITITWTFSEDQQSIAVKVSTSEYELNFGLQEADRRKIFVLRDDSNETFLRLMDEDDLFTEEDPVYRDMKSGGGFQPAFRLSMGGLLPGELVGVVREGMLRRYERDEIDQDDTEPISRNSRIRASWANEFLDVSRQLRRSLQQIAYLGPLRQTPQRYERFMSPNERDVGTSGEYMLSALFSDPRLVLSVNNYLAKMEMPYRIKVTQLAAQETLGSVIHMSLMSSASNIELSPSDVGVGYSQVLPLIAQSVMSRNSLLCVEQPELHLHPAMQARLADVFIEAVTGGSNVQYLIETHSESLMLRFLRRIREGEISADAVQVLYIDQDKNGNSTVVDLPINENGEFIERWPHGFFDERLEELGW